VAGDRELSVVKSAKKGRKEIHNYGLLTSSLIDPLLTTQRTLRLKIKVK
jgi:hypothetical protein